MPKKRETKVIKETNYCKIYSKVSIEDDEYNSCIERIEVKRNASTRIE